MGDLVTLKFKAKKHPPITQHHTQEARPPATLTPPMPKIHALHFTFYWHAMPWFGTVHRHQHFRDGGDRFLQNVYGYQTT